jgi:hypothetical protein
MRFYNVINLEKGLSNKNVLRLILHLNKSCDESVFFVFNWNLVKHLLWLVEDSQNNLSELILTLEQPELKLPLTAVMSSFCSSKSFVTAYMNYTMSFNKIKISENRTIQQKIKHNAHTTKDKLQRSA